MAALTEAQQIPLILLTLLAGIVSCLSSLSIIALALMRPRRRTYHRLLLLMSTFDIISSITWALQPFVIPKTEEDRVWASGNDRTCSTAGFFTQLGFATVLYNGSLNTFYLLTIRFRMDEEKFAKRVESFLHALSILYPLVTACVGVGIGLFSPVELGSVCWISEYPRNCDEDPTVTCVSTILGWIYAGVPLLGTFLYLLWSNLLIYCQVRSTMKNARNRSQRASQRVLFDRRGRDVGVQASLYVAACLSSIIWMIVLRSLESIGYHREDEQSVYPLLLLAHTFYPLQGFWNLLIYLRPRYIRWRRREPNQSWWWCLRQSMIRTGIPGDAPNNSVITSLVSRVFEPSQQLQITPSSGIAMARENDGHDQNGAVSMRPSEEGRGHDHQHATKPPPRRTLSHESYFAPRKQREQEEQKQEESSEQDQLPTTTTTRPSLQPNLDEIHECLEEPANGDDSVVDDDDGQCFS